MTALLPVDVADLFHEAMLADRRPPDGLLHCSSHLVGSLRHAMLDVAGAPQIASEFAGDVTLLTGTMLHRWAGEQFTRRGIPVMLEVNLTPWLPPGWAGTADWVFWSPDYKAFVLGDLKSIKGEGIPWIQRDGAKEAHRWQLSAYWYALRDMGLPLVRGLSVFYMPKNRVWDRGIAQDIEPVTIEFDPINEDELRATMAYRWAATAQYLTDIEDIHPQDDALSFWTAPSLAPVEAQRLTLRADKKRGLIDVLRVPPVDSLWCPYPEELCDCATRYPGQEKIGHWVKNAENAMVDYIPREGYYPDDPLALPIPPASDWRKLGL